ncbi:MAG: hypothetical protein J6113_08610, partial [Lachnospiraceae bacterium]|nr:hypothetical protein [Lachnospiraceae bacterium]
LLNFLTEKKVSSSIMDQDSIDKLISFLQSDEGSGFRFDAMLEDTSITDSSVIILPGNENINDPEGSRLSFKVSESDTLEIFCTVASGAGYAISPDTVQKVKYLSGDDSSWGRAITPRNFDLIAKLLNAKYTKETYVNLCTRFATVNYPANGAVIASIYLPGEGALLERMIGA